MCKWLSLIMIMISIIYYDYDHDDFWQSMVKALNILYRHRRGNEQLAI